MSATVDRKPSIRSEVGHQGASSSRTPDETPISPPKGAAEATVLQTPVRLHCSVRSLSLLALLFGLVATGALSLAVATDFWIYIEEPIKVPAGNDTDPSGGGGQGGPDTVPADPAPGGGGGGSGPGSAVVPGVMNIRMHSGLWRLCIIHGEAEDGVPPEVCYNIEYFNQEWGRLEGTDTTNSILRAIRKASPVIVGSLLLLLTALALGILGNSKGDFKTIVSAIIYIFSALCLALGVIIYISAVNDEVAHRKKTESTSPGLVFSYRYGWAFFFGAATFMCAMVAAVSNISLHLRRLASAAVDDEGPPVAFAVPGAPGYRPVRPSGTQEVVAEQESVSTAPMNNNVTIIL